MNRDRIIQNWGGKCQNLVVTYNILVRGSQMIGKKIQVSTPHRYGCCDMCIFLINISQGTMFMEKSKQSLINGMVRKKSQMQLAGSTSMGDFTTLKKASSCSTIYIDDSTVSQPNLKNTIKCVSLAIYYHIKNRTSDTILDIFDEKKQPLTVSTPSTPYILISEYHYFSEKQFLWTMTSITPIIDRFTSSSEHSSMLHSLQQSVLLLLLFTLRGFLLMQR